MIVQPLSKMKNIINKETSSRRITITPDEVRALAQTMDGNTIHMGEATNSVSRSVNLISEGSKNSILGNVNSKISSLSKSVKKLEKKIEDDITLLYYVAENFEDVDKGILAGNVKNAKKLIESIHNKTTDLGSWNQHANHAEYALLSSIWSDASATKNPEEMFFKLLEERTQKNDPIRYIDPKNVEFRTGKDGFAAVALKDDKGNATVIFAGTHDFFTDGVSGDVPLVLALPSTQTGQARKFISDVSQTHKNITVTGHSLGGYLASFVTLHNSNISNCVTFDAPGYFGIYASNIYARFLKRFVKLPNEDKITSYITKSIVNKVGVNLGDVRKIDIPDHDINKIYDQLGGDESVKNNWNNYDFGEKNKESSVISYTEVPKDTAMG